MSIYDTPQEEPGSPQGDDSAADLNAAKLRQMSIAKIEELEKNSSSSDKALQRLLELDERIGVRRLAIRHSRRFAREEAEKERLQRLLELERRFWAVGTEWVAGVDEVGRGCLAGPVVAAAVVFPPDVVIPGLNDSKKLTPEKRELLQEQIRHQAVAVGLGLVEAREIDKLNILHASLRAMRLALANLGLAPGQVLIDGNRSPGSPFPELAVVEGDARSLSIAAASVVAKVHRDRLMVECGQEYPQYGFASHKGYGSAAHLKALKEHGPCSLHRHSFAPVAALTKKRPSEAWKIFAEGLESCWDYAELERLTHFIKEGAGSLREGELEELRRLYKTRLQQLNNRGRKGEIAAADFLISKGYEILERNYRGGRAEIDLIVLQGNCLVFVEVKSSWDGGLGHPEERVGETKQVHLIRAARHYIQQQSRGKDREYRFDVIAVSGGRESEEISHVEDAFRP